MQHDLGGYMSLKATITSLLISILISMLSIVLYSRDAYACGYWKVVSQTCSPDPDPKGGFTSANCPWGCCGPGEGSDTQVTARCGTGGMAQWWGCPYPYYDEVLVYVPDPNPCCGNPDVCCGKDSCCPLPAEEQYCCKHPDDKCCKDPDSCDCK